jgi:hypothetical protein
LRALESRPTVFDDESELDVMQRVSLRILKSHDWKRSAQFEPLAESVN